MQLKGTFEPSSLASILQLLSNEERTGALHLTNGEDIVKIFIRAGDVICATGSERETRLGTLLTRSGLISSKDLAYCLAVSAEKKQALGNVLVSKGFVSDQTLKQAIHRQAEEVIYNLFSWKTGDFEYTDSSEVPQDAMDTKIDIMGIIMEAMRRIDEMSHFREQIPNDDVIFAVTDRAVSLEDMHFSEAERAFIALIDGKRTVRELLSVSGFDDFAGYHLLNTLIGNSVIEKVPGRPESENSPGNYADIVIVYHQFLEIIRKNLVMQLGAWMTGMFGDGAGDPVKEKVIREMLETARTRWARTIIDNCKPQLVKNKRDLFYGVHPENSLEANIQAINRTLGAVQDKKRARLVLSRSFNLFVSNLVRTFVSSFGFAPSRAMLAELNNKTIRIHENKMEFPEKEAIVKEMMDILISVARQNTLPRTNRVATGRILALPQDN